MYSNIRNTSGAAFTLGKWVLLASVLLGLTACQSLTKFNEDSKSKLGKVHFVTDAKRKQMEKWFKTIGVAENGWMDENVIYGCEIMLKIFDSN